MAELISEKQARILKHTIGLDWKKAPFRNYYNSEGTEELDDLVTKGLMIKLKSRCNDFRTTFNYFATVKGIDAVRSEGYCKRNKARLLRKEILMKEDYNG